jgi:hypothetical protein
VKEVRQWYNRTHLQQTANSIAPSRKGYINSLKSHIKQFKTMTSNSLHTLQNQQATRKQATHPSHNGLGQRRKRNKDSWSLPRDWEKLDPSGITPEIRKRALRCHHIYDIKRDSSAKNRVVVNGSKQHSDTYTDTTSPVASQLQLRIF